MLLDMLAARADLLPALAAVSLAVGGLSIAPAILKGRLISAAIIAVTTIGTVWVSAEGYQRHDANTAQHIQQIQQVDPGVGVAKTTKPVKAAQGARDE